MDVYGMVTQRIINELEKGYIPWRKPWAACTEGAYNRITKRPYSLLNQLLLGRPGEYASFAQWRKAGGSVRKGEKSSIVVFWKLQDYKEKDENGEESIKRVPLLRYYNVFHIDQVEGVDPLEQPENFYETEPIERAEEALKDYLSREQITLHRGRSNRAFYRPSDDSITLPDLDQFEKAEEFYSTAFHECGHSTLKASRCDREAENRNAYSGSSEYSKEELIAEICSAAVLHELGIETPDTFINSAAYIQNWISVLKNDKRFIVSASGKAEKAARYILNIGD